MDQLRLSVDLIVQGAIYHPHAVYQINIFKLLGYHFDRVMPSATRGLMATMQVTVIDNLNVLGRYFFL